jgi:alanine-glyoxylate transaminase/serine-glyoxylate transaminase/serine-pyruvate transaminase
MSLLGMKFIPKSEAVQANTLTAPYYPEGLNGGEFLGGVGDAGVIIAGGLLSSHKALYFRVGHMGIVSNEHIEQTVSAIKQSLGK